MVTAPELFDRERLQWLAADFATLADPKTYEDTSEDYETRTKIGFLIEDEDDMALGNIVGSNLFNLLGVAGPVGLVWGLRAEGRSLPLEGPVTGTAIQLQLLSMAKFCLFCQ